MRRSTPATPAARSSTASARVVGVNTAVAGVGLGLAVPINAATRQIIGALMRDGASAGRTSGSPAGHGRCLLTRACGWGGPEGSR